MDQEPQGVAVDIGGGFGEYFRERARQEPNKQFVILEPRRIPLARKPKNLHMIRYGLKPGLELPLKELSVDEANINMLFEAIGYNRDEDLWILSNEENIRRYAQMLAVAKRVLKSEGVINIVEGSMFIPDIRRAIELAEGLQVVEEKPLEDERRSYYVSKFSKKGAAFTELTIKKT